MRREIKIKCPICDGSDIKVIHIPETKADNLTTTVGGKRFKSFKLTKEKYEPLENCPNCGASKEKIEKALNTGDDYKKPSHDKIMERMKAAGLATRV